MPLGTILLIILILLVLGALPTWPYSGEWGYYPSGGLGLVLVVVLVLVLMGRLQSLRDPRRRTCERCPSLRALRATKVSFSRARRGFLQEELRAGGRRRGRGALLCK